MQIKFENPKMKQSEIANQIGYSNSTLQCYRNVIKMISPYRMHPNNTNKRKKKTSNTDFDNNSHRDPEVKRPQMPSNDFKRPQSTPNENGKKVKKNNLKGGVVHNNIEINDQKLNEILNNNII